MQKSLLSALVFITLITSCAPASTASPIPTPAGSASAVEAVDKFYSMINTAQSDAELTKSWAMLSATEQCNPKIGDRCDLSYFQANWWQWKVTYKLYDCGTDQVVAEQRLYPRESDPSMASPDAKYIQYHLVMTEDGTFLIDKRNFVKLPGAECVLKIDSANP